MAFLAKFAASKYVGEQLEDRFAPENPRYDVLTTESGRRKKRRKQTPPGLHPQDEQVLLAVRQKAWRYEWLVDCDCCCCCCFGGPRIQFGTAAIWGIIPVVGDLVSLYSAVSLVRAARGVRGGLPAGVLGAMVAWALVDFVIKLVPVVGDVLTAIIKPNTRNCMMVEDLLRKRGERNLRGEARGDPPLLVSTQPGRQTGMSPGGDYGTLLDDESGSGSGSVSGSGQAAARVRGVRSSRHLLPFWSRNEDTDSEVEDGIR
ncbi:hypothetical protein SLS53_007041 [Cytospora paraplurivora]|uniref:DUF4112 domain-containing protein n=1 Tax=Cytospora paraplurivora TaxID=2898453 RepID=A0AAN9U0S7_9PEZI